VLRLGNTATKTLLDVRSVLDRSGRFNIIAQYGIKGGVHSPRR